MTMDKRTRERRQNFKRLAVARVNKIMHDLYLIRNLSNTGNYQSTQKEVDKMFETIRDEVDKTQSQFYQEPTKFNLK